MRQRRKAVLARDIPDPNPSGVCMCGCGQTAPIATITNSRMGRVKDKPERFIHNHHGRKRDLYRVEDRGYKTPCWIWLKSLTHEGYGQMHVGNTMKRAHRVFYEEKFGPIPVGLEPDHLCRIRACCNPDHLEPVTQEVNIQRRASNKLNPDRVRELRALHASGRTVASLARQLRMSVGMVRLVVKRRAWKNIL